MASPPARGQTECPAPAGAGQPSAETATDRFIGTACMAETSTNSVAARMACPTCSWMRSHASPVVPRLASGIRPMLTTASAQSDSARTWPRSSRKRRMKEQGCMANGVVAVRMSTYRPPANDPWANVARLANWLHVAAVAWLRQFRNVLLPCSIDIAWRVSDHGRVSSWPDSGRHSRNVRLPVSIGP